MSQRAPSAPSTFTAADLAEQPSSYAYDLALSLGEGGRDVAPLGTAHRPDGTTTQYLPGERAAVRRRGDPVRR